jgi:hypothetical protein
MTLLRNGFILSCIFLSTHSFAFTVIENSDIAVEGAAFEVLYNSEKDSGSIILQHTNCSSCSPVTIQFNNPVSLSINGYSAERPSIDKSFSGKGDISYNPETMILDHINVYQ